MQLPGLIVKKIGMSRMVDGEGRMIPVTLLKADNQKVTKLITNETQGYHAVQVGYFEKPESRMNRPDIHRLRKAEIAENFSRFKEIRLENAVEGVSVGAQLSIDAFKAAGSVDVSGLTKGRGFQGAIKRHGSAIGRMTHGSCYHRRTGSIGSNTTPGRVLKNKKMPGQMGVEACTIQNLTVMDIDVESNTIALKGSVPGHNNSYLVIRPSIKVKPGAQASKGE